MSKSLTTWEWEELKKGQKKKSLLRGRIILEKKPSRNSLKLLEINDFPPV